MRRMIQNNIAEIILAMILGAIAGASKNWIFISAWVIGFSVYILVRSKHATPQP